MKHKRVAIITGASSGIGKATAIQLAKNGIFLVLNGRNLKKLEETSSTIDQISGKKISRIVCGDVYEKETTLKCIDECIRSWDVPPSIFIASAGRGLKGTVVSSDLTQWEELIQTNITGMLYQLRAIADSMINQLKNENRNYITDPLDIIVLGSTIGRNVSPFNPVYGATKFAVHGLTEGLRRELGPKGIRVTLIEPGLVATNFQEAAGYEKEWFEKYAAEVGPVLQADDIADLICFLLELPGNINLENLCVRPTRQAYP
jgi:NADP-dependent 3-hydroxy acid dehydrogenase YdfG